MRKALKSFQRNESIFNFLNTLKNVKFWLKKHCKSCWEQLKSIKFTQNNSKKVKIEFFEQLAHLFSCISL